MGSSSNVEPPETKAWETRAMDRVSIHDPAATLVTNKDGEKVYYVFGTHISQAKTTDFLNWEVPQYSDYENMEDNILLGNAADTLKETFEWAGHDDADSAGGFNLWAPDAIWNEKFEWANGDKGAYLLFYSASSTWRRSAIALVASQDIEGPYTYVDTIIYSGFTSKDSTDGSMRNTHYEGTHLPELIEEGIVSEFKEEWVRNGEREYNTDYAPNAIDPAPFYDEDGKLMLVYGSWSGGTHLLELDEKTGIPLYPGEDGTTQDGRTIDRYFGTKLSGGFHQSGEGPYIVFDEESDYYYLFLTYGGLTAQGGYNMRLFRSENVYGPYLDMKDNTGIIEAGDINENYGIKLSGNYNFSGLNSGGYRAPGHNSVVIDDSNNWFNVFHTRFDSGNEMHEVRVHQMVKNKDDWPVQLPFEYRGVLAELGQVSSQEIGGEYEYLNFGTTNATDMIEPSIIELTSDGKITGDIAGEWTDAEGYLTLSINGVSYSGVMTKQPDENDEMRIVFSAYGDNNEMVWGIRTQ
ncbi:glycoside hydrolase family 43 protein [Alkalibacterium sp. f15]|uniref:glycoside hydrolase family 43 protein n=1 Tax=Alkalibacterium sp. f15 TaxID=3414029 RepID=UPI003BF7EB7C